MLLSPRSDPHHPGDASENPFTLTLHWRRRGSKGSEDAESCGSCFALNWLRGADWTATMATMTLARLISLDFKSSADLWPTFPPVKVSSRLFCVKL